MTDLTTRYLGFELRTPIVASAGPVTGDIEMVRRVVDAGASAVVLPSLFEEEIVHEEVDLNLALESGAEHHPEALGYFPGAMSRMPSPIDRHLDHLAAVKDAVDVPVIASVNATSSGSWIRYAALLTDAGADAIELNVYEVAADASRSGAELERDHIALVTDVCASISVPVAVKLSPYYSSLGHVARSFERAGAAGLVCFNRFYQPDLDVDTREVVPRVELSSPWELRLPLRWIAILRPVFPHLSLAASSGVETGRDVAKALLVGADIVMTTSSLLRHGPEHIAVMEAELRAWAEENEYDSVTQLRGSVSHATTDDPGAFERANYVRTLHSWVSPSRASARFGTAG
ncbi:MAG TPA: dihydroorotate dehydrogenase-like protein [Acidimicrobiales bacterium]|nr:dihydroorotate dehydrogenase-like protein [Acidimicrobiales bacterium]